MTALETEALIPIACRLAGVPISHLELAASGGNSRIYRAQTQGKTYALKYYAPAAAGTRNRLAAEVAALRFFEQRGIASVPKVYGSEERFALYDWVDGKIPTSITIADSDKATDFLAHFPKLSQSPEAAAFGPAAEACLSLSELLAQIDQRVARLKQVAHQEPALHAFLEGEFAANYARYVADAQAAWKAQGWDVARELPYEERCLVPGDYGFHNVLRTEQGDLAFIDFEYFGWDDPVKLVADTLLHPGYQLSPEVLRHLRARLTELFSLNAAFAVRFATLLPLFSLRWALILCNEFLVEKRVNRAFAANIAESNNAEWERRKQVQLAKARAMLSHPVLADSLCHAV